MITFGDFFFEWNGDLFRLPDNIEDILCKTYTALSATGPPRSEDCFQWLNNKRRITECQYHMRLYAHFAQCLRC